MMSRVVRSLVALHCTASSSKLSNSNRNKFANSNVRISNSVNIPLTPLSLLIPSTRTITPNTTLRFSNCKLRRGQLLEALNRESGLLSKMRISEAIIITRGGTKRKIVMKMTREWTKPNSALDRLLRTPCPPFSPFLLPSFSLPSPSFPLHLAGSITPSFPRSSSTQLRIKCSPCIIPTSNPLLHTLSYSVPFLSSIWSPPDT